ncbi:hypothetical protein VP01_60g1 [Puccinia sorghi]|uniref:Uncharacterized protein n=1 Tax=Puccinia sorghi TaxID=27349 RepID=A0A0L6UGZ3_9BASI|nr:hypothetical protein VP01_60g1 [Puccinia sorghi]
MKREDLSSSLVYKQSTYCNHPIFAQEVIPNNQKWRWQDLGKLVHLVQHPKVSWVTKVPGGSPKQCLSLPILMRLLYLNRIEKKLKHNNMMPTTLSGKIQVLTFYLDQFRQQEIQHEIQAWRHRQWIVSCWEERMRLTYINVLYMGLWR